MKVSIVTPSRLAPFPGSAFSSLWLDGALKSARYQTADVELEMVVGVDDVGTRLPERFSDVRVISPGKNELGEQRPKCQASALNAAIRASTGEVIAILEDDDRWDPTKLAAQLPHLDRFDLITCNQREVDIQGNFVRVNDFPTPSGWLMRRETFERVGEFDEMFKYHIDTEWLGRANAAALKRVHLIHDGYKGGEWLDNVSKYSAIEMMGNGADCIVTRILNPDGGMATIARNEAARTTSFREHAVMIERFGMVPW